VLSLYPRPDGHRTGWISSAVSTPPSATKQLIDAVDLGERARARSMELSVGQQQRLSIALALVNDPELIFLDEPTTGLDPQAAALALDLVKGLQAKGKSIMLTTPLHGEAPPSCATAVAIMDHATSWIWARFRS